MAENPSGGTVQSVERALDLMEYLAAAAEGLRLSDLARAAGLAVSTTHRLLTTLERRGFAQFDPSRQRWFVGRRAFTVGIAYSRWQSLIAAAQPFLRRLRDMSRETANLGVLEGGEVVTVAQVESREIMRAISATGGRTPVLNSGMGKAILATWPDEAIQSWLEAHPPRPATRHSLQSPAEVLEEVASIRRAGYAIDNEEFRLGMRCVAAVVWGTSGEPIGALSVSALAARLPMEATAQVGAKVRQQGLDLSQRLGGEVPAAWGAL